MSDLTNDLRKLEDEMTTLIKEFEIKHGLTVHNIKYEKDSRPVSSEALFDTIYRIIKVSVKLP